MKKIFLPLLIYFGKRIEKRKFSDAPIYIGGCGRSGTTLLLSILSAHPDIFACPKELFLFENSKIAAKHIYTPKFYRLYRTFIRHKIKRTSRRYCEKSPSNILYIDLIDKLHNGNFKFIHLIRDGRDVILSKHPRGKSEFWVEPTRWINDVSIGLSYKNHPNVLTIRYEELVSNYSTVMESTCKFLNIEFIEELKNWHENTTVRKNNALFSKIEKINANSVGKWKRPEYQERVKELTSIPEGLSLLNQLGYKQ